MCLENNEVDYERWINREKQIRKILIIIIIICSILFLGMVALFICDIVLWKSIIVSVLSAIAAVVTILTFIIAIFKKNKSN